MLAPHERQTYQRIATRSEALAVHDTTELEFGGEREGLGPLSRGTRRGFFMHVTLAVAAGASRHALGVVTHRFWGWSDKPRRTLKDRRLNSQAALPRTTRQLRRLPE